MKTMTLMMMLALGVTAHAQDADLEKYWILFMDLRSDPETTSVILQQAGVSKEGASVLAEYAVQGMRDLDELLKAKNAELCANTEVKTSRAKFADAIRETDRAWNAQRANLAVNIGAVLSQQDEHNVRYYVAQLPSPRIIAHGDPDLNNIRSGEVPLEDAVDRACGGAK